ncbi:aspartic proteinase CDR1 [Vigna angularis]|uniref:aspartic proteinase CDR1 n=1 Tax=Phaseolus angularis TaxID=3914 RepID=UPI0022B3C5C4|nr:aspartic proteinase CDR1 [Vigna angularis]
MGVDDGLDVLQVDDDGPLTAKKGGRGGEERVQYVEVTSGEAGAAIRDDKLMLKFVSWEVKRPCKDCYKQDRPIFDPSTSRTYSTIPCVSADCLSASHTFCNFNNGKRCAYKVTYGDGSTSEGDFSWDTITLTFSTKNVPVAFPQTVIGCGHNNYGIFGEQSSGIVGLGIGAFSLAGQLKPKIGGTFSYCLTPMYEGDAKPSYLHFGDSGEVSVEGAVSTPLIRNIARPSMYFVVMEAISVGSKRIEFPRNGEDRNIFIESGTTISYFAR